MRNKGPGDAGLIAISGRHYLFSMRRGLDFSGRSDRSEFWRFWILYAALYLCAFLLDAAVALTLGEFRGFRAIVTLVHAVPNLALLVRRLHDIDRRGWFVVWPFVSVRALYERGTARTEPVRSRTRAASGRILERAAFSRKQQHALSLCGRTMISENRIPLFRSVL